MALSIPYKAAEIMEHLCNHSDHGYSQPNRAGIGTGGSIAEMVTLSDGSKVGISYGDRDCSSAVIECYAALGIDCGGASYTGNMRSCMTKTGNFTWHPMGDGYIAKRGDIYLNEKHHTAMCLNDNPDILGQFSISETGGITGKRGDQTAYESNIKNYYNYPWDGKLVYVGDGSVGSTTTSPSSTQSVDLGDETIWGPRFTRNIQIQVGTYVDGIISGQPKSNKEYFWAVQSDTIEYANGGSVVIKRVQQGLINKGYSCGSSGADGLYGHDTIKAHQRWLIDNGFSCGNSGADGYNGYDTNRAVAKAIKAGAYRNL